MRTALIFALLALPTLGGAAAPCIPAELIKVTLVNCQALGELAETIAQLRDAGMSEEYVAETLPQATTPHTSRLRPLVKTVYAFPHWNPSYLRNFVDLMCLKEDLAIK
jgi:hypothetical protein